MSELGCNTESHQQLVKLSPSDLSPRISVFLVKYNLLWLIQYSGQQLTQVIVLLVRLRKDHLDTCDIYSCRQVKVITESSLVVELVCIKLLRKYRNPVTVQQSVVTHVSQVG